jgi:carboxynorspermidine decarboxylase
MRLGVEHQTFLHNFTNHPVAFRHLEGLHFHLFCSQDLNGLKYLLAIIKKEFQEILPQLKWLNLGGGHRLTDSEYDREGFITLIRGFRTLHPHLTLYFEPGESVVKHTGCFITTILDIIPGEIPVVILDTSIETHLLDVAITGQKPAVRESSIQKTPYHYQLSGMSCIAGDIIGDYYFKKALQVGEKIIFDDMMGYTMVKQTQYNGIEKAGFRVI